MYGGCRFVCLRVLKTSLHRVDRVDTSNFQNGSVLCPTCLWQLSWLFTFPRRLWQFCDSLFLQWGLVSTSPNPQAGGQSLVSFPRMIIWYIRSCPLYWTPFVHPQPTYAPCAGDRNSLVTEVSKKALNLLLQLKRFLIQNTVVLRISKKNVKHFH